MSLVPTSSKNLKENLLSDVQKLKKELKHSISSPILWHHKEFSTIDDLKEEIQQDLLFIEHTIDAKLYYFMDALAFALKSNDYLIVSRVIRAYLEHFSSFAYLIEEAQDSLKIKNTVAKNKNVVNLFQIKYRNLYYSSTLFPRLKGRKPEILIKVSNLINAYDSTSEHPINQFYNFLCDFTHPYYGSNLIVINDDLFSFEVNQDDNEAMEAINQILFTIDSLVKEYPFIKNLYHDTIQAFNELQY